MDEQQHGRASEEAGPSPQELAAQVYRLTDEVAGLRRQVERHPRELELAERRLAQARGDAAAQARQNERLVAALGDARDKLVELRSELEALGEPPSSFGLVLEVVSEGERTLVDVSTSGRRLRVGVSPEVERAELVPGRVVLLNESMVVIGTSHSEESGEVVALKDVMPDGLRAVVVARGDEEDVVLLGARLRDQPPSPGDSLLVDRRAGVALERVPKLDVEDLVLEEVPDIDYSSIGGLGPQIEQIRDAVELPFLHRHLFTEYDLEPPKGILLYGPPGCGKTMIAKAVANSLARKVKEAAAERGEQVTRQHSFFLNVKGPELLNKYVGETERHIRLIFARAREKASDGMPVVIFFDEMESLFRTRGTGVSSDVENTIVPQLLSEIDGVESLANVIVIGASNREDMIDPAILRPGRLDVKIKVERPDAEAAREIFAKYLTATLPLHPDDLAEFDGDAERCRWAMIDRTVEQIYSEEPENEFLEVTYAGGDKEVLYFKDFTSGAMVQNVVGRAKKLAIKEQLATGVRGIRIGHLLQACSDEFAENEDLPNTTNPDDWARISGKKGERIVYIRTLVNRKEPGQSRAIDTISNTGQYL
ncbi:proteasome ATPase [Auraticoccus sp. F435]|uniref:AAA ATPase forming ring-shaped complexes n=1 Tax=Auraticoccus cholistanensis TaxID=2656650 RepID=A0A6A9UXB4_9ACTN|nr:proteasome ATPase [Auraticoccus cholistanensis]MVA75897.1 proteasome ATPase [Auraticoccus cholistanensis]